MNETRMHGNVFIINVHIVKRIIIFVIDIL